MIVTFNANKDHLGYARFKFNQSVDTQESPTNNAGTLDDDSDYDSESDEPTIVISSLPNNIAGSHEKVASDVDDSTYAKDLARLKKKEHAANEEAERLGLEFAKDIEALLRQAALDNSRTMDSANRGLFLLMCLLLLLLMPIPLMVFLLWYLFLLFHPQA
jgi:hypothetical protein